MEIIFIWVLRIIAIALCVVLFFAGIVLHKIGTLRKWELEEEQKKGN